MPVYKGKIAILLIYLSRILYLDGERRNQMLNHIRKILIALSIIFANNMLAIDVLPANTKNKEITISLELWIKDIQAFINSNKPVAANSLMQNARDELRRIRMRLTKDDVQDYERRIQNQEDIIKVQKDFQMKKYGKLREVN